MQTEFRDQRAEGADRHTKVADIGIGGVVVAKRDAYTPKYRDRTTGPHEFTPCSSSSGGAPQSAARCINAPQIQSRTMRARGSPGAQWRKELGKAWSRERWGE